MRTRGVLTDGGLMMGAIFGLGGAIPLFFAPDLPLAWWGIAYLVHCALGIVYERVRGRAAPFGAGFLYLFMGCFFCLGALMLASGIQHGSFEIQDEVGDTIPGWIGLTLSIVLTGGGGLLAYGPLFASRGESADVLEPGALMVEAQPAGLDLEVEARPGGATECPYCHDRLDGELEVVPCGECAVPHHRVCLEESLRCAVGSCGAAWSS